jgi:rRNA-processing protein FCF1
MEKVTDLFEMRLKGVLEIYKKDREQYIEFIINEKIKAEKKDNAKKLIGKVFSGKIAGASDPHATNSEGLDLFYSLTSKCIFLDIGMDFPVHLPVKEISDEIMNSIGPNTEIQVFITDLISSPTDSYFLATTDLNYQKNISQIIRSKNSDIFIFDTNSIIDYYEFLKIFIENKKQIIIPYIVLEELDNLKRDTEKTGKKAREALKKILEVMDKIKFEDSYPEKLSFGFDKRKNDNLILSVAIHNKGAVIVTEDIGLLIKASSLNIGVCAFSKEC